ncbi:ribonuclease P protein component [Pyrinomonas methylaliphatogenes]|jgi:ribonuclease P protein component|uniref:Ribonuclease P protein component n=1 Tax=Pyrinomonas methylaliphatogenes TaxID=454194 RepID=A0A0B6X3A6_9BACT|nr:ribonuclease P protein component [Pyrinomonas methylaliphatogenes]
MVLYAKTDFSAEQSSAGEEARVSSADVNEERAPSSEAATGERAQAAHAGALLRFDLPRSIRLRRSSEFRLAYTLGRRYDGRYLTAFVRRNELDQHRIGVTASRRTARHAVQRNRLKRLLREAFRLSRRELESLKFRYDWVLNANRPLIEAKVWQPLAELRRIIAQIAEDERKSC